MLKVKEEMKDLNNQLEGFYGTESYFYKHWVGVFTDGIKAMADQFRAYWLIDLVFSYQDKKINSIPFQIWEIVSTGDKATVEMKEDTDKPILVRQKIGYTDFPKGTLKMYYIDDVLMLPNEY